MTHSTFMEERACTQRGGGGGGGGGGASFTYPFIYLCIYLGELTVMQRLSVLEPLDLHGGVSQWEELALKVGSVILLQVHQVLDLSLEAGGAMVLPVIQVFRGRSLALASDVLLHSTLLILSGTQRSKSMMRTLVILAMLTFS